MGDKRLRPPVGGLTIWVVILFVTSTAALGIVFYTSLEWWWLPLVILPAIGITIVATIAVHAPRHISAAARMATHFPETLTSARRKHPLGQPGQEGLKRFPSIARGYTPGQEWNYRHGAYRDSFFATFSFFVAGKAGADNPYEEFHVAYIPTRRVGPTAHIASADARLPMDLRLSKKVRTESHEFNERWIAYAHDAREAHAVLSPRVIELLNGSRLDARAWIIENGALAMVGTQDFDEGTLAPVLDELHALAGALPASARHRT